MTFDRATARFLDNLSHVDDKLRHPRGVDDLRALTNWLTAENGPGPGMESVGCVTLDENGIQTTRLRVLMPRTRVPALVVYLPGPGCGWVAGSLESSDTMCRKLAERTGCAFVVVECRKAPEHPYPAAVDDAWQALLWAEKYRRELPAPTPPLVLVGEGSGGALASVLARRSREADGPAIGSVILISPSLGVGSFHLSSSRYDDGLFTTGLIEQAWSLYLPRESDRTNPDAVPLRARDFAGHPPTLLLSAGHDPLTGEGYEYLARLASAGVPTERREFAGQMHGFFGILELPQGERAFQAVICHVRSYVARTPAVEAA